jgi:hypothetical protein
VDPHQLTSSDCASELDPRRAVGQSLLSCEHTGLPVQQCRPLVHAFQHWHLPAQAPPGTLLAVDKE